MKQQQGIHTVERTYRCDICNRTFKQLRYLKVHQHVHTGKRLYSCDVCNKIFKRLENLKVHQREYTGERPSAVKCVINYLFAEVICLYINVYILGSVHIAVVFVIKHSSN